MLFNAATDIAIISVVLAVVSQVLQHKLTDRKAMKAQQKEMREKSKRVKELAGKKDARSQAEAGALQKEIFESMGGMMQGTMRLMVVSLVIYGAVFFVLGQQYGSAEIGLPVPLPWFGIAGGIELYSKTNWLGWYVVCALVAGIAINGGIKVREIVGAKAKEAGAVA